MADRQLAQFVLVDARPDRVWKALVDPDEIVQWLAESCDVDFEAGRYGLVSGTPGVSGDHRVLAVEPGRRLQLAFAMAGHPTTLDVQVTEHEGRTRVVTRQTFEEHGSPIDPDHVHELWAYNNSLLKTWIELGEAKCRLASDRAPDTAIRHEMTLAVPSAEVFAALTEPARIRQWNAWAGEGTRCDGRVGGRYSFGWKSEDEGKDGPDVITEWEPGRKVTYRWHGDPPTLVSFAVEPLEGSDATKLTLVHSGFGVDQNMLVDYNLGWADFLANIAVYVERGVPAGWSGVA